jgi:nucleotide-binding universal stress UspA family protein
VRLGPPARTIAQLAGEHGAQMIVLGLGRHNVVDRYFSAETALETVRLADVPVLAVARGLAEQLPHRAVVATDFGELSRRAAQAAARILRPYATLYLVHVRVPVGLPGGEWGGWGTDYASNAERLFERMRAELSAPPDVNVETVLLPGDPTTRVLELAESAPADLIAAGSHGQGFFARMVLGSVSTRLLRGARCSVLIVPPPAER